MPVFNAPVAFMLLAVHTVLIVYQGQHFFCNRGMVVDLFLILTM